MKLLIYDPRDKNIIRDTITIENGEIRCNDMSATMFIYPQKMILEKKLGREPTPEEILKDVDRNFRNSELIEGD